MGRCGAFLMSLALSAQLSAAQNPKLAAEPKSLITAIDHIPCSIFEWNSEKNVMRVPLWLNGRHNWYQLDTGADMVIAYGSKEHEGWSSHEDGIRIPNVRFAGMSFPAILAYRMKNLSDENLQGTVGLDLLVGRTFVIDFPRKRVCLVERADLPGSIARAADWVDAEVRHGKLFIPMKLNGKELDGIVYDTGSSPTTLDVNLNLWRDSTGKSSAVDALPTSEGESWGHQVESVASPALGDLVIGRHVFSRPIISTAPNQPDRWSSQLRGQGLLGNALFLNSIIILDLGAHPRFGVIDDDPSSAKP